MVTSVRWGYRGQGPQALAAILADSGVFSGFDDALDWVEMMPQHRHDWRRQVGL